MREIIGKKLLVPNSIARDTSICGVFESIDEKFVESLKNANYSKFNFLVSSGGTTTRCCASVYWTLDLRKNYKDRFFDNKTNEIILGAGNNMGELLEEVSLNNREFPI